MGLFEIRNGQVVETRILDFDTDKMTTEECRVYIAKLEEEIRELREAGK